MSDRALTAVSRTMSEARISRYLRYADDDKRLALRLHAWNAAVAGALLPLLHVTEVAIRNFAVRRLIATYGKQWYERDRLLGRLGSSSLKDNLRIAVQAERDAGRNGNLTDFIANELTFGFWANVYTRTFVPDMWTRPLHTINASVPSSVGIARLHAEIEFVRTFRNNVAHHKNLIKADVPEKVERTLQALGWICRDTGALSRAMSTFPMVWACAPVAPDVFLQRAARPAKPKE